MTVPIRMRDSKLKFRDRERSFAAILAYVAENSKLNMRVTGAFT